MKRVSISLKCARDLLTLPTTDGFTDPIERRALEELRSAVAAATRKSAKKAPARKAKREKRPAHNLDTSGIRGLVFERAGGRCEFCKGDEPTDMHHALGRVKQPQAVSNCLALCRSCHEAMGRKSPTILELQASRFERMGHGTTAAELRDLAAWLRAKLEARERLRPLRELGLISEAEMAQGGAK